MPYCLATGEKENKEIKIKKIDYYNVTIANYIDKTNTFSTRSFMVRYAEEFIELYDICQFRTEIDFNHANYTEVLPFYMEVSLYCYNTEFDTGFEEIYTKAVKVKFVYILGIH